MYEFLPKEVRDGIELARSRELRRKSRLRLLVDGQILPIRRLWNTGVSVDASGAPHMRGLVDVYDGSRHLCQCLIIASEEAAGEMVYEFKRQTFVTDRPALDYEADETAPVGLIGRA